MIIQNHLLMVSTITKWSATPDPYLGSSRASKFDGNNFWWRIEQWIGSLIWVLLIVIWMWRERPINWINEYKKLRNKRLEKNIMAAFKALKKERKLSKLPWLILSQLSKHIQKSHAKPTTHRNSHGQKSISNPMSHLPKLRRNEPRCSQRHSHETLHVNPNRHGFLFCYTNLSYETRSFSPNPLPSSSDLPIWTHLMLR